MLRILRADIFDERRVVRTIISDRTFCTDESSVESDIDFIMLGMTGFFGRSCNGEFASK